jgi:GTP-binding protein
VGKSTLFNRLCHGRRAIVDPQAGVTRDRKYEEVVWNGRSFIVVDTGGIIPQSADTIDQAVRFQAEVSIEESDFILFVVDAQSGVTDMDEQIARILGPHREKVMLVANKVDNEKNAMELYDFLRLGFNDAFPVSAAHGRNTGNFLDALLRQIKTAPHDDETVVVDDALRVAIVGKPNVGKSSLVNRLTGEEAVIVSEIPAPPETASTPACATTGATSCSSIPPGSSARSV